MIELQPNLSRIRPLGSALSALPEDVYVSIDRAEPEWPVLEHLARAEGSSSIDLALALGLSDFQLGAGGADLYWQETLRVLSTLGAPSTNDDARQVMLEVLSCPVSARLRDLKSNRVEKLFRSRVPARLKDRSVAELGEEPMALWHDLAGAMGQPPQAKTVAFAMKLFDLLHRITTGQYVNFPTTVPIVADLRIARVSISSGLLTPASSKTVPTAMSHAGDYASSQSADIINTWAQVSDQAGGVSLFRIDSLIWQAAEPIHLHRMNGHDAHASTRDRLVQKGAGHEPAEAVAAELTWALAPGSTIRGPRDWD